MDILKETKEFLKNDIDQKGQFNAFLAGPIIAIVGVIIILFGIILLNAIVNVSASSTQNSGVYNQPNVQSMLNFVPYAGIGVVIGGILLTIVTVFSSFGR